MITAEIKINGNLIGYLKLTNEGERVETPTGETSYCGVYMWCDQERIVRKTIRHKRTDGAEKLIRIALEELTP